MLEIKDVQIIFSVNTPLEQQVLKDFNLKIHSHRLSLIIVIFQSQAGSIIVIFCSCPYHQCSH